MPTARPVVERGQDRVSTRRTLLRGVLGSGLAACWMPFTGKPARADATSMSSSVSTHGSRRLIIVIFGGGTRSSETIDDPQHRYIPHLWEDLAPKGTLLTNMRVEHRVVHPNSTGSIITGHWEWDDNDWSRPVAHATPFEIVRRAEQSPDTAAWAFVYASILAGIGHSTASGYGRDFGANVVQPPTIPRSTAEEMSRLMQEASAMGSVDAELEAARRCADLARSTSHISRDGLRSPAAREFIDRQYADWKTSAGTTSHDTFLTQAAIACMREFSPEALVVAYGEIDCAHYGSWSRYVEAIRRTDVLTWRLWDTVQSLPGYRDRTLMLILPDHGRELERPGGMGFIHHSNFYANEGADEGCRRVWMLALGPGIAAGRQIGQPFPITASAATGLEYLDVEPSAGASPSLLSLLT